MRFYCRVFRGLAKEAEEEVNKFLASHEVRVEQMVQSESGDHITITLLVEILEAEPEALV